MANIFMDLFGYQNNLENEIQKKRTKPFEIVSRIYYQELELVNFGYAPVYFKEFVGFSEINDYFLTNKRFENGGAYNFSIISDRRVKETFFVIYRVSVIFNNTHPIDSALVASCHECKHNGNYPPGKDPKGIQTGNRCKKHGSFSTWEGEKAQIFQPYSYSFSLFGKSGYCPYFQWRRGDSLKWKLQNVNRPLICFFCKGDLTNTRPVDVVVHHKIWISFGGAHNVENLEYAHRHCHDQFHIKCKNEN
jgi:5-methylcytosine-specific restriction endonuclease McrA